MQTGFTDPTLAIFCSIAVAIIVLVVAFPGYVQEFFAWVAEIDKRAAGRKADRQAISNADAKAHLQALRESELSVGAILRRGGSVDKAPGQIMAPNVTIRGQQGQSPAAPARVVAEASAQEAALPTKERGGYATSVAMGLATGDVGIAYAAGGSASGAILGAALGEPNTATDVEQQD